MDDPLKARPVSGEIMTGASLDTPLKQVQASPELADDVVDADYEVVRPVTREGLTAAGNHAAAPHTIAPAAPAGIAMLRENNAAAARKAARGGPLFWIAGAVLVVGAFWVSGGHALVRQSASLVAPEPQSAFSISGVTSRVDASGAHAVLLVDGQAANDGGAAGMLPALTIAVTTNGGKTIRYNLGTSGRPLEAGEKFTFSSRLDVPKDGVKAVSVTFAE